MPSFVSARSDGYVLTGMSLDAKMVLGMMLIVFGIAAVGYGLVPRGLTRTRTDSRVHVRALDDAPLRPAHYGLMATLLAAIAIDTMKPFTFAVRL